MKKALALSIVVAILMLSSLFFIGKSSCHPIREGTYTGRITPVLFPPNPNDYNFPYDGATAILVIKDISKEAYVEANKLNVLEDETRTKRGNYYSVTLSIVFDDDRETILVSLQFTGSTSKEKIIDYLCQDGYLRIRSLSISLVIGEHIKCDLYRK